MKVDADRRQPRIQELESLRGIAAALVVLYHIPKWGGIGDIGIINNAYLMVDLFFVLSGFVIFSAYDGKINSGRDLLRFQFLRFGRLYPVHLIFLLFFAALEALKHVLSVGTPFPGNTVATFVQNLFFAHIIWPGSQMTFNWPSWSISVEFYTYLLFGIVALGFGKLRLGAFVLLALVPAVLLATGNELESPGLLRCFSGFFGGVILARVMRAWPQALPAYSSAAALVLLAAFVHFKPAGTAVDWLIYPFTAALVATLLLEAPNLMQRIFRSSILVWLGTISYTVYMSQAAVVWTANQIVRFATNKPTITTPEGILLTELTPLEGLAGFVCVCTAILFVSQAVYSIVEKPLREYSRKIAFAALI